MVGPDIFDVLEATWPPVSRQIKGSVVLRDGGGGGKRVSSACILDRQVDMQEIAQSRLFQVRADQVDLDSKLADHGYEVVDPTLIYAMPIDPSHRFDIPPVTVFEIWPPLELMRDIWSAGGIGPARIAVMERVTGPKTGLFGRINDRAGGAGFVAIHDGVAMLHALEVLSSARRNGLGRFMSEASYNWAADQGATTLALAVTEANEGARKLYTSLGMSLIARYHYRLKEERSNDG